MAVDISRFLILVIKMADCGMMDEFLGQIEKIIASITMNDDEPMGKWNKR